MKDSHPMLTSLLNVAYNVSGWTDYADLGSLMPETTTTKPITNSPKKKSRKFLLLLLCFLLH